VGRASRAAAALSLALAALGAAACGDRVQDGLTGIDVHVTFDSSQSIDKLLFAGWSDGQPVFEADPRPLDDRMPSPDGENLIILLPREMGGREVFVRVDGMDAGKALVGSTGRSITLEPDVLVTLNLSLGEARICGDGDIHPQAEQCDDGNSRDGDGCASGCVLEPGSVCEGVPSKCRTCGNGECEEGENPCTCGDCTKDACGDGCCALDGREQCGNCEDCDIMCGDEVCCSTEVGECEQCDSCGIGGCQPELGEDACSCPSDCTPDDLPVLNNGYCCALAGEVFPAADCCEAGPVDGVCCGEPLDHPDCCDPRAGFDGICCAGESPETSDCCSLTPAICGDGICCTASGENAVNCGDCGGPMDGGPGGMDGGPGGMDAGVGDGGLKDAGGGMDAGGCPDSGPGDGGLGGGPCIEI